MDALVLAMLWVWLCPDFFGSVFAKVRVAYDTARGVQTRSDQEIVDAFIAGWLTNSEVTDDVTDEHLSSMISDDLQLFQKLGREAYLGALDDAEGTDAAA